MAGQLPTDFVRSAAATAPGLRPDAASGRVPRPEIFSSCSALSEVNHFIFSFVGVVQVYMARKNE